MIATDAVGAAGVAPASVDPASLDPVARPVFEALVAAGDPRYPYRSTTLVGCDRALPTDAYESGLNNNMLVVGPSGAGKTRHVLKPNLLQMSSSFVVLDTKGTLCREVGPFLASRGYDVQRLDFSDLSCVRDRGRLPGVEVGYDPLSFVRSVHGTPSQQDILSVAKALCPVENGKEPFWDHAAANLLAVLIAYVLEELPEEEREFGSVICLAEHLADGSTFALLDQLSVERPRSFAASLYRRYATTREAERMHASIVGILAEKLMCLGFDGARRMYRCPRQVDFARLGHCRRALFVTMSDIDRALDPLTSLFVNQAFTALMREADRCPGGRLPVPVRFLLDDFANLYVPRIDEVLSVARSRELWVTMLVQSVSQIEARYGRARAMSIMGNCDAHLVLAFQGLDTARWFSERADRTPTTLFQTPAGTWWLFLRGHAAEQVGAYRLEGHPLHRACAEAERAFFAGRCDGVLPDGRLEHE